MAVVRVAQARGRAVAVVEDGDGRRRALENEIDEWRDWEGARADELP